VAYPGLWNLKLKAGKVVSKRYYIAVYTDSGCVCGCDHKHSNIATATACISQPGGYVVAVCREKTLPLTDLEEAEFQRLTYGKSEPAQQTPDLNLLVNGKLKSSV